MTTPWIIPADLWAGQTVAVLCPGPGLTPALADSVRHLPRIAVRRAFALAPDADLLVSLDGPTGSIDDAFWPDAAGFAGARLCGVECEVDALYAGMWYERVSLAPGHVVEIRNNGLAAIRIAARAGAAKILLLGFDAERYETIHAHTGFRGLAQGLAQISAGLAAAGIVVEHLNQPAKAAP